ncbi:MAG: FtsH protease activity modulator HflK [Thermoanaerobaculia bacterium]|nr:FtsH protease activity modulator HflK [Thermoanaerobaculia bacterium]
MADDPQLPWSIRWIWRLRDTLNANLRIYILGGLVLVSAWWLSRGIYTVNNGESAALLRFGALIDDGVSPGLRFRLPAGIEEATKVRTAEVFRLAIRGDYRDRLDLVTGDENLIESILTVQYRITRLGDFLFSSESAEELVRQTLRAEMVESIAALGVDDVLTSSKALIQQQVRERSQERLDAYHSGVALVSVNLQSVDPPQEAAGAFLDVLDARAEAAATLSRMQAEQDRNLSLAHGESAQRIGEAESEAHGKLQAAQGAVERFRELLLRRRQSPGLTRTDLYVQTLQDVLPRTKIIVLAPGETPRLDVQLIETNSP